ncbi:MAG: hypothetical protein CEE42_14970 [Promethearchaeota archaeon Loki_b31]|nr:MAG: hypothetical protein CEE42_14970 [Candidatus Lokiarchaeota archaeon Loki_b31]
MSIQGKKEGICRLTGTTLIFISLTLLIIFNFFILNNLILYLILILINVPPLILSILIKLELDFITKNSLKFLFTISTIVISLIIVTIFFNSFLMIKFVLIVSSNLLLTICWHFSLSIYKKKKIIFIFSGTGYCILIFILWLTNFVLHNILVLILFPLLLVLIGIMLIIIAELSMKKKGLLNYI